MLVKLSGRLCIILAALQRICSRSCNRVGEHVPKTVIQKVAPETMLQKYVASRTFLGRSPIHFKCFTLLLKLLQIELLWLPGLFFGIYSDTQTAAAVDIYIILTVYNFISKPLVVEDHRRYCW